MIGAVTDTHYALLAIAMVLMVVSILVPLAVSTTSHQIDNARWMATNKAAIHLPQRELTPDHLAGLLQELDRAACHAMAQAAYEQGRRDANEAIARVLEGLVTP